MKKHILVVSQYFYPEQFRIIDICNEWIKRGFDVTVVTGIPNYPEGRFFKGYNWFKNRKEIWNGINIIRLPILPRGKNGITLFINYISFVIAGWFFTKFTRIKANYVFTYEVSPIFQAKLGCWYGKRRKIPSILYVMDLWPENVEVIGGLKNKFALKTIENITRRIYHKTTHILTTSKSFIPSIVKMGVSPQKVSYWPQYAEDFYQKVDRKLCNVNEIPNDKIMNLVFAGNVGYAQGLEILHPTAKLLKDRGIKVRFNIIGDGRAKGSLVNQTASSGLSEYFNFIPKQKATDIPCYLASCDAAILTLINNVVFEKTIPAKLQSYMACGIPIIANASGEVKSIIEEAKCGFVSKIGDYVDFADQIQLFINMNQGQKVAMSVNALEYNRMSFSKVILLDEIEQLFSRIEETINV